MTAYGGNVKAELELGTDKFSAAWKKVINDLNSTPTPSGPAKIQREVDKLAAGVSKSSSTAQSAIQKMGTTYDSVVQKMQNSTNSTVQRIGNQLDALGQRFNPNRIQDKFDSVMRKLPSTAQSAVSKVVSSFDAISSRVNFNRISDKFDATIRQMASSARSGVSNITSSFSSMETGIAGILGTVTAGLGISQLFEMGQAKAVTQQMLSNMGKGDFFEGYEKYTMASATSDADINRMFQWVAQTQGLQAKDVERALSAIDAASYSTDPINRLRDQTAWAKYIQGGWDTAAGAMRDEPISDFIKQKMQAAKTAEERIAVAEEFARLRGTMDAFGFNLSTTTTGAVGDFNAALVGVDNLTRSLRDAFSSLLHELRPAIDWFNQLGGPMQKLIGEVILGTTILIGFSGALKLAIGALSPLKGLAKSIYEWLSPTPGAGGSSALTKIASAALVIGVAYISAELIKWSIERLNDPNYMPTAGGQPLPEWQQPEALTVKNKAWEEWNKNPLMRLNPFMPVGLDVGLQNFDIADMVGKILFGGTAGQSLKDMLFPNGTPDIGKPLNDLKVTVDKISAFFGKVWNDFTSSFNYVREALMELYGVISPAIGELKSAFGEVWAGTHEVWGAISEVGGTLSAAGQELWGAFKEVGGAFNEVLNPLREAFGELWTALFPITEATGTVASAMNHLAPDVKAMKPEINLLKNGAKWLADGIRKTTPHIVTFAGYVRTGAGYVRTFANYVRTGAGYIRTFAGYIRTGTDYIKNFANFLREASNQIRQFRLPTLNQIIGWIRDKINQIKGGFNIGSLAGQAFNWVYSRVSNIFGSFNISALAANAWEWVKSRLRIGGVMSNVGALASSVQANIMAEIARRGGGPGNSSPPNQNSFIDYASGTNDGASSFLDRFFNNFTYESYDGSRKSIAETINDMSGNCVDGTFAQVWMAGQLGVPMGMEFTTWKGHPHMMAIDGAGRPKDIANHAITGSWDRPPAGPGDSGGYGGVFIAKGAIQIQGDINGIKDAEKTMEKVFIRMANKYLV